MPSGRCTDVGGRPTRDAGRRSRSTPPTSAPIGPASKRYSTSETLYARDTEQRRSSRAAAEVVVEVRRAWRRRGRPGRHRGRRSTPCGRCRAGRRARSARRAPGCRRRRSSRPGPRGCAGRCARRAARSSVSKNQPSSSIAGSRRRATSARTALNPHCASRTLVAKHRAQDQVVGARDELALRRARHRSAGRRAASRSQRRSGRTRAAPPSGSSASRSVDRSTSMYATTAASLSRPRRAQRETATLPVEMHARDDVRQSRASRAARNHVPSVDALSTIVMRHVNGKLAREVVVQALDAGVEHALLVVDRDHDVDARRYQWRFGKEFGKFSRVWHASRIAVPNTTQLGVGQERVKNMFSGGGDFLPGS